MKKREVKTKSGLRLYKDIYVVAKERLECFMPQEPLLSLLADLLRQNHEKDKKKSKVLALTIFEKAKKSIKKNELWSSKLQAHFDGNYPKRAMEFWKDRSFAQCPYQGLDSDRVKPGSFSTNTYDFIPKLSSSVAKKVAPKLYGVKETKAGIVPVATADVSRFISGSRKMVPHSGLHEIIQYNRPMHGVSSRWAIERNRLPVKFETAKIHCKEYEEELLGGFLSDLKETFAWKSKDIFVQYIGYLLQAMFSHYYPGQSPGYSFEGPTKSGKNYLAVALPEIIYSKRHGRAVLAKAIPETTYELETFLYSAKDALYIINDEIIHAREEDMKRIDSLITQDYVTIRKMNYGHISQRNYFTVGFTAVGPVFSDETESRVARIILTESRPTVIDEFHLRWREQGPKLLAALFDRVSTVNLRDLSSIQKVQNRRPGFALMAHVLNGAFNLNTSYPLVGSGSDLLDTICEMFEKSKYGASKPPWTRYSLSNLQDFISEGGKPRPEKRSLEIKVQTALAYGSTRRNPQYKEHGYAAESGRHYHVELRSEGITNPRKFICVQKLSKKKVRKSDDSDVL